VDKKKKIHFVTKMIIFTAIIFSSLIFWVSWHLIGQDFWYSFAASIISALAIIAGLAVKSLSGHNFVYNHIFGAVLGTVIWLEIWLIFSFWSGLIAGMMLCLIFSIRYLTDNTAELRAWLKYMWHQIKESVL